MPSPFPGMNPYLEDHAVWQDFHDSYLVYLREALAPLVRPRYFVGIEEHLYVHDADRRRLGLGRRWRARPRPGSPKVSGTATLAPVEGLIPESDTERHGYLAIRSLDDSSLVTVIELLSPANKNSSRDQYLAKREEALSGTASFVEIDLLRGGHRPPVEGLPLCHYYALVSRPETRPRVGLWPISLHKRLPEIPIPLRDPGEQVALDLQAVLHRTYDAAGYEADIYRRPPTPRLAPDDAAWASQLVPPRS